MIKFKNWFNLCLKSNQFSLYRIKFDKAKKFIKLNYFLFLKKFKYKIWFKNQINSNFKSSPSITEKYA